MTNQNKNTASVANQTKNRRLGSYTYDEIGTVLYSTVASQTYDSIYTPVTNAAKNTASVTNQTKS